METLKPCPFCKNIPILVSAPVAGGTGYKVKCNNYDCWIGPETSLYSNKDDAIKAWNWRANETD